jgi:hypothetical protein
VHVLGPAAPVGDARRDERLDQRRPAHQHSPLGPLALRLGQRIRSRGAAAGEHEKPGRGYAFLHATSLQTARRAHAAVFHGLRAPQR